MTDQPKVTSDPIEPEPVWRGRMSRADQQNAPKRARGQGALAALGIGILLMNAR